MVLEEPDADPSTLKDNPMTIEREVLGPPFFVFEFLLFIWFLWLTK